MQLLVYCAVQLLVYCVVRLLFYYVADGLFKSEIEHHRLEFEEFHLAIIVPV